jgi:hypothetical protein
MATAKNYKKKPWKTGATSRHITNLKQSILETFDIYELISLGYISCKFLPPGANVIKLFTAVMYEFL